MKRRKQRLFFYCSGFPNYGGIQAIVCASSPLQAGRAARDQYYGMPSFVRVASTEEINWHRSWGGTIIHA